MQLYKHYYEREMMNPGDNPPVGIVLGSETDSAVVKYTLNCKLHGVSRVWPQDFREAVFK